MITYENAKNIVSKNNLGAILDSSYKLSDGYLFLAVPKDLPEEDFVLGGYFKVAFSGQLQEYSPVMNPEEFKQALINRIE